MKKVRTEGLKLGTKRTYSMASSLSYTWATRPCKELSTVSELQQKRKFRKYAPANGECAMWEPWELQKYFDIEVMDVRINEQSYTEREVIVHKFYRTVTRRGDLKGRFKWIEFELKEIANQYSKDLDEVMTMFGQVNCDKKRLRDRLAGNSFCVWKKLEDLILQNHFNQTKANGGVPPTENSHYKQLLEEKGASEIQARMKFLGLVV